MRDRNRRARAAVALAAAAVLGVVLPGCSGAGSPGGSDPTAGGRPSPKPTPVWDTSPRSVAAVGDSITRGFDACSVLADCPEVSWATGNDVKVRSLALRLLGKKAVAERSWNHAASGARVSDLPAQVERAVADRPELLAVMVGANDACRNTPEAMTSVADFRTSVREAMRVLRRELPKTQVFMASVPDLKRLWSQGRTNPLGKQVWKLGICSSMLAEPDAMDTASVARRDAVQDRVVAYNKVIADVCGADPRCRDDGGAVFDYRFTGRQLSPWDWFHPSRNGQSQLADIAYRAVTAKKPPQPQE